MKSTKNPKRNKMNVFFDKKNNRISTTGFTITETMVVVVVFTVVMSLALIVFLASVRAQRTALFQQRLTTETNHALNRIAKEIRSGEKDEGDINKGVVENILRYDGDDDVIEVTNVQTSKDGERITVLIETRRKVDEERYIEIKLQTTAKKR